MSAIVSPDCRDQNHQKCPGDAWDESHDHATECQCACHANGDYPALQAAHAAYKRHLNTGELATLEGALAAAVGAALPIFHAEALRDAADVLVSGQQEIPGRSAHEINTGLSDWTPWGEVNEWLRARAAVIDGKAS